MTRAVVRALCGVFVTAALGTFLGLVRHSVTSSLGRITITTTYLYHTHIERVNVEAAVKLC